MYVFAKVSDLKKYLTVQRVNGLSVGFVPTMGALHDGHLSLIQSSKENDITVCSIFVNPKQFNDESDLDKYPRTMTDDIEKLHGADCDVLFCPSVDEVYPTDHATTVDLDISHLTHHMEGTFRPGHFEGMLEVVHRLLELVQPDTLYMGQKDFQQYSIVQYMLDSLDMPVALYVCPIIRESNGLAMSSRNERLTPELRLQASVIYNTLVASKDKLLTGQAVADVKKRAMDALTRPGFKPEYVEVVGAKTLEPITSLNGDEVAVICIAVWVGEVRLIDNMRIEA